MGCILPRTCYNTRMTNYHNDINADDQFIMHDAMEDARDDWDCGPDPDWDGNYPGEDDIEWVGTGGDWETGDWIGPSDADPGL